MYDTIDMTRCCRENAW